MIKAISHYSSNAYHERLHEIRERECSAYRDAKARKMMEELKGQRKRENKPSPRCPVLVCKRMKHLPS